MKIYIQVVSGMLNNIHL